MMAKEVSETARERESIRYAPGLLAASDIRASPTSRDPSTVTTSADSTLTALAQLGVFRCDADLALISLFDHKYQHIVAEASRTTSIAPESRVDDQLLPGSPELWLCGDKIPREHGICEHVIKTLPSQTAAADAMPDAPPAETRPELPVSVFPDLSVEARFEGKPYFGSGQKDLRFYAGVPIRSPRGIDIGVYSVYGKAPRHDGLDSVQSQFLQDMSQAVMSYLRTKAHSQTHQRNVRMVRGLGSLVEGKGSMSRWWLGDSPTSFANVPGAEGSLNTKQQAIQRSQDDGSGDGISIGLGNQRSIPHQRTPSPVSRPLAAVVQPMESRELVDGFVSNATLPSQNSGTTSGSLKRTPSFGGRSQVTDTNTALDTTNTMSNGLESESIADVKALFSRAANIIRESIEVEGVLFLDAAIEMYSGLVDISGHTADGSDESTSDLQTSSGNEEPQQAKEPAPDPNIGLCNVLGFSMSASSSIDGDSAQQSHLTVPEKFLKSLLRHYPTGRVFNFDETGAIQTSDSETDGIASTDFAILQASRADPKDDAPAVNRARPRLRRRHTDVLTTVFSGCRSLALVPLWDAHKERWFSCGFVWTRNATRIFSTESELSYLKALGQTIMAEVARLDILRADKAKADVLGSLSHELRSPLHGIILGVELLYDTELSSLQGDLLHTLQTCSYTLRDTMDHLLDYSKVNHYMQASRKRKIGNRQTRGVLAEKSGTIESGMMSLHANISLDTLIEEVIESVYAGISFQQATGNLENANSSGLTRANMAYGTAGLSAAQIHQSSSVPAVAVYFNIDPSVQWAFYTQPGAIRRIVMNLFGNALKYTARGSILVAVTQEAPEKKTRRRNVILSISDSGKGISLEYLRNRLFTPFAQEDHLVAGAGLGLSLVKQITSALGGNIAVESRVGRGTTVRVTLPLTRSSRSTEDKDKETEEQKTKTTTEASVLEPELAAQVRELQGKKVRLTGFAGLGTTLASPIAVTTSTGRRCNPTELMEKTCTEWLHLNVVSDSTPPDVHICTEDAIEQVIAMKSEHAPLPPVVAICRNVVAAHKLSVEYKSPTASRVFEFVSQPCGPHKLAKIVSLALRQHELLRENISKVGPDSITLPHRTTSSSEVKSSEVSRVKELAATAVPPGNSTAGVGPSDSLQADEDATFLLVDDNAVNLKVLGAFMTKYGRRYSKAWNGLEAVDACRQASTKFKCILMDISMPVMDGMEATRQIRKLEQGDGLPPTLVIALTGLASLETQREAFASGVDLFLTKPVPLKELGRILESKSL